MGGGVDYFPYVNLISMTKRREIKIGQSTLSLCVEN